MRIFKFDSFLRPERLHCYDCSGYCFSTKEELISKMNTALTAIYEYPLTDLEIKSIIEANEDYDYYTVQVFSCLNNKYGNGSCTSTFFSSRTFSEAVAYRDSRCNDDNYLDIVIVGQKFGYAFTEYFDD